MALYSGSSLIFLCLEVEGVSGTLVSTFISKFATIFRGLLVLSGLDVFIRKYGNLKIDDKMTFLVAILLYLHIYLFNDIRCASIFLPCSLMFFPLN